MGHICAFVTPSMPGLVKIGATARDPAARLAEANAPTPGRPPEPYYLACSFSVPIDETFQMKRALYAILADRRVNARRDFSEPRDTVLVVCIRDCISGSLYCFRFC